jgi:hypothetical protein
MRRLWIPEAPAIMRPRGEIFLSRPAARFEGWFEVELIHARTGSVVWRSRFRNLITNNGLNSLGGSVTPAAASTYVAVGTDGTAPGFTDGALGAEVVSGRVNANGGTADVTGFAGDNSYSYLRRTRFFSTSEGNGILAEVGTFALSGGGVMFSRQQIKDSGGVPTTINKTADFELRVTYELRTYIELVDQVYTALVNGVSQNVTVRPSLVGTYSQWTQSLTAWPIATVGLYTLYNGVLGATTGVPTGTSATATSVVLSAYVDSSYYREITASWNAGAANMLLKSFRYGGGVGSSYQHEFSAPPTKDNTLRADLIYRITWGRA